MKRASVARAVVVALAALAAAAAGVSLLAGRVAAPRGPRFFLLGVDGLDPDLTNDLLGRGELPNLARLLGGRPVARLRTDLGLSPLSWTSLFTGVPPEEHGITGYFVHGDDGELMLMGTPSRKVSAIWDEVDAQGLGRQVWIGPWSSWPAPRVNGVFLSHIFQAAPSARPEHGLFLQPPEMADLVDEKHLYRSLLNVSYYDPEAKLDLLERLADQTNAVLAAVFYDELDDWQHFHLGDDAQMRRVYRDFDGWVGRIAALARPDDTFWIVGDHGIETMDQAAAGGRLSTKDFPILAKRIDDRGRWRVGAPDARALRECILPDASVVPLQQLFEEASFLLRCVRCAEDADAARAVLDRINGARTVDGSSVFEDVSTTLGRTLWSGEQALLVYAALRGSLRFEARVVCERGDPRRIEDLLYTSDQIATHIIDPPDSVSVLATRTPDGWRYDPADRTWQDVYPTVMGRLGSHSPSAHTVRPRPTRYPGKRFAEEMSRRILASQDAVRRAATSRRPRP